MSIVSKLQAQIIYGEDYWDKLSGNERRAIILNNFDCRVEPDCEDTPVYPEDDITF